MERRMQETLCARTRNVSGSITIFFLPSGMKKMTRLTSANLKLRTYIHVCSSVAKELDISMSAIGFSRTPFPLQFQPFHRIFLSAMTLIRSPVSSSKIASFPLDASHSNCCHSIKNSEPKKKNVYASAQNMFSSFANL